MLLAASCPQCLLVIARVVSSVLLDVGLTLFLTGLAVRYLISYSSSEQDEVEGHAYTKTQLYCWSEIFITLESSVLLIGLLALLVLL